MAEFHTVAKVSELGEGEGTTVAVTLPLVYVPPATSEPASNVATLTPAPRSTPSEQPYQVKKSA